VSLSPYLRTKADPVSKKLCFLVIIISGDGPETRIPKVKVFLKEEQTSPVLTAMYLLLFLAE
jgi:hypothetical protein